MEHLSDKRRLVMILRFFWFFWKKVAILEFFRDRFDIPHCELRLLFLTLILDKLICVIHWFLLNCIDNVIFDGAEFFGGRKFFAGEFLGGNK